METFQDVDAEMEQRCFNAMPEHVAPSVRAYVRDRRQVGQCLKAIIDNDLTEACGRADEKTLAGLHDIIKYLYNCAPAFCWGAPLRYEAWINREDQH